jgi:hypothetical protein
MQTYICFVRIDASLAAGLSVEPHAIIGVPYPQVIGKSGDGPGRGYFRAVGLAHELRRNQRAAVLKVSNATGADMRMAAWPVSAR